MTDNDFGPGFDRYSDQVRHPALELALFAAQLPDDPNDGDDDVLPQVPAEEVPDARRRHGALLAAANMIFDRILDDAAFMAGTDPGVSDDAERFVDEFFPQRNQHMSDEAFHRKLLATVTKVGYDLANPVAGRPACTAEELVLWAALQQWQILLDLSPSSPRRHAARMRSFFAAAARRGSPDSRLPDYWWQSAPYADA